MFSMKQQHSTENRTKQRRAASFMPFQGSRFGQGLTRSNRNLFRPRLEPLEERRMLSVTIDAGDHVLLPDTPGQEIEIYVSGADAVSGVEIYVQIADGGPEAGGKIDGPSVTGADLLTDTIFAENNTGQAGMLLVDQIAQFGTTTSSDTVDADGLLATVTIDTTGFMATSAGNPWALMLSPTLAGNSNFPQVTTTVVNGTITIGGNLPPTDIVLSDSSVDENEATGTVVGTFSTSDPDPGDTFTYSLVTGNGDTDNGLFTVAGDQLQTNAVFDHETGASYSIRVRSTDDGGESVEKAFSIAITDMNDTPTADGGGPYSVAEGGTITLNATGSTDDDLPGDTLTYTWDFDGDGEYDDATGAQPVFSAANLDGTKPAGTVEVGLKVTDASEASDLAQVEITVTNVGPTVTILGASTSVRSGVEVNLTADVNDPAPADTHTYQWNVNKNGTPFASGTTSAFDFTPNEEGTFTVTLTVTDDDGDSGTDIETMSVSNTGPVADAGGPYLVDEGSSITLDASGSYDPDGGDATLAYAWDFDGDGEYDDATNITPTFSAVTLDGTSPPKMVQIGLKVTDGSGDSNFATANVEVSNVAPTATIVGAPTTSPKGVQIDLTNEVIDPGVDDTFDYSWTITRNGSPFASGTDENISLTPELIGSYVVSLAVTDDDGGEGTDQKTIVVENATPVADAGGPYDVNEGGTVSLDASATTDDDLPNETLAYAWDFDGDGEYDDATGVSPSFSAAAIDGTSPVNAVDVALRVRDISGDTAFATTQVRVANVSPTVEIGGAPITSPVGTVIDLTSTVDDPGALDTHSYLWEVRDSAGVVATGNEANFSFTPTQHADYSVTLTVTDDDQGASSDTTTIRALTDLGEVDSHVGQVDPGSGDRYYSLQTAHPGYLTVEVIQADPGGTVSFALLDDNLSELDAAPNVGAEYRTDWQVAAGETYSIALVGTASDVTLRITNLVNHTGTNVTVYGTSGDDTFDFNAQNSRDITINNVLYPFEDAEVRTVQFDGGDGTDLVTLQGSAYSESLLVGPQGDPAVETAVFEVTEEAVDNPFTVTATGFEQLLAWSRTGGHDVATFHDSPGTDKLKGDAEGEFVILRKLGDLQGFYRRAKKFDEVHVIADVAAEKDLAVFVDSEGDDQFTADAKEKSYSLSGPGYVYGADLFTDVLVRGDNGGTDSAEFVDSPAIDKFRGTPVKAWLFSLVDPFSVVVRGFTNVTAAFPNGGYDKVRLFNSAASDQFVGRDDGSVFQMSSVTFTETGAEYVLAYSEERDDEADTAALYKASLADLYEDLSEMTRLTYDGTGRIIECMGFEQMDVFEASASAATSYEESVDRLMQEDTWDE